MQGIKVAGYETATPIQEAAIPAAVRGRDIIGTAQTGTGKTAAFVLTILNKLLDGPRGVPRALIVTPTRELAEQINHVVHALAAGTGLRSATIYGGVGAERQIKALRHGVEILVACPGRLLDLIQQRYAKMERIEISVLDEGDRMTLPVMLLISVLAVFFETIPWLRGGFGNVVYACLWLAALIVTIGLSESTGRLRATNDPMGMTPIGFSMLESARQIYPGLQSGFVIAGSTVRGPVRTFVWDGATWTVPMVLGRSLWIGVSFVLVTLAALLFDRFDPSKERWRRRKAGREMSEEKEVVEEPAPVPSQAHLTPLNMTRANISGLFGRTLLAELRIMLKGVRWWWYAVALGLIVAALFSPLEISRQFLLPAAWICPILLWSPMGNREKRYRVDQLVFSVAHPLQRQLPAIWCAGFLLAVLTASGVIIRLAMTGHGDILVAMLAGAAFIPSLALALGSWSGSGKLFEVLYLVLWYTGPVSRVAILDYMGVLDETLAKGIPVYYAALSLFLMGLVEAGWRRKV